MTIQSKFSSTEAMEKLVAMGMEDGMKAALGQIEHVLRPATQGPSLSDLACARAHWHIGCRRLLQSAAKLADACQSVSGEGVA